MDTNNYKSRKPLSAVKYGEPFRLLEWFIDDPGAVIEAYTNTILYKQRYSRADKAWKVRTKDGTFYGLIEPYKQVLIQPRVRKVTWCN
tara:strand:- start:243 stop:506 length:264 start_codon:yes stop_codon:yes gene_type:complete